MYEKSDGRVKGSSLYYFGGGLNGFAGLENGFELLGGDAVEALFGAPPVSYTHLTLPTIYSV